MALNHSLVGTAAPPVRTTVSGRTLSAWQHAVAGDEQAAALLAGLSAAAAALTPPLLDPRLRADMMRLGQDALEVRRLGPVAAGDVVDTTATIAAIVETEAGERLELQIVSTCRDAVVVDATAGVLLRGPRRKTPLVEATATAVPGGDGVVIDPPRIASFCEALGEHNPLFVDEDAARQAGLPACVAPNLGLFALAWRLLGAPPAMAARFRRPALAHDVVGVARDGRAFSVVNQAGVVLVDGTIGGAA